MEAWKRKKLDFVKELRARATPAERKLWAALQDKNRNDPTWPRFCFQRKALGYILDFCAVGRGTCVEVDGGYHTDRWIQDAIRTSYLGDFGMQVLRFSNERVLADTDGVMAEIFRAMEGRTEVWLPPYKLRSELRTPVAVTTSLSTDMTPRLVKRADG